MKKNNTGFTLIELIVALSVMVVLAIFVTGSLSTVLRSRSKTEVQRIVRQEAEYASSTIQRHLRGAVTFSCSGSTSVSYTDIAGQHGSFACVTSGSDSYVASGSGQLRLTSTAVKVQNCSFACISPDQISSSFIVVQAQAANDPRDTASSSASILVTLRNQ